jgi:hypothetical protein
MENGIAQDWVTSVLLVCCAASFLVVILSAVTTMLLLRKNASLVELLHVESRRHTSELLTLNERFNAQLYNYQEKVQLEHVATLRQLLESFAIAASGKSEG